MNNPTQHWSLGIHGRAFIGLLLYFATFAVGPAQAQTETVLHSFQDSPADGSNPLAGLVFDKEGNLYGTTSFGGEFNSGFCFVDFGCGTVFEVTSAGKEKVLFNFGGYSGDASYPGYFSNLVFGKKRNLYGTTSVGGAYGLGTVFELAADGTEKVLHSFQGSPADGADPEGSLVFDREGNLYGTTSQGGAVNSEYCDLGCGTVFEITAAGAERVVYSFGSQPGDGNWPEGPLVFDKDGNLYGTTSQGGGSTNCNAAGGCGTVFKLAPDGTEKVLYAFQGAPADGAYPLAGVIFDRKGNLYGTTYSGGSSTNCNAVNFGCGTVFKLAPDGTEKVRYSFQGPPADGAFPVGGLVFDKKGNLYGTNSDYAFQEPELGGTVFEITKADKEKVLYFFCSQPGCTDGDIPLGAGVVFDKDGSLYGTTYVGGAYGVGTVFKVTP